MSNLRDVGTPYCPACGRQVASAQVTVADEAFSAASQGVSEGPNKHVVIEGAQVSVYVHEESGGR